MVKGKALTESDGDGENGRWRGRAMARAGTDTEEMRKAEAFAAQRARESLQSGITQKRRGDLWGRGCLLYSPGFRRGQARGIYTHGTLRAK